MNTFDQVTLNIVEYSIFVRLTVILVSLNNVHPSIDIGKILLDCWLRVKLAPIRIYIWNIRPIVYPIKALYNNNIRYKNFKKLIN